MVVTLMTSSLRLTMGRIRLRMGLRRRILPGWVEEDGQAQGLRCYFFIMVIFTADSVNRLE